MDRDDQPVIISSTIDQIHQNMEEKSYAVERQMKSFIQNLEEKNQRMEANVDNAFRKALDVQKIMIAYKISWPSLSSSY